jgi:hypothetical protein
MFSVGVLGFLIMGVGLAEEPVLAPVLPTAVATRHDICRDDALLLITHPIAQLENDGWRTLCCGKDPVYDDGHCEMDWPSSDVPDCSLWDDLRNQIYARYGYPFEGEKWSTWSAKQAWYVRRVDFSEAWISPVAKANVAVLKRYKATRHHCTRSTPAG